MLIDFCLRNYEIESHDVIEYVCTPDVSYAYEFTEPIVTTRICMYVAIMYVMSLRILMLWLNLRVLLYISFNGRWSMYVYSFTILYAIKRIYVIH